MALTYEPITTTTLVSPAATITLSGIPSTYTDLRLVLVHAGSAGFTTYMQYNNDTSSSYEYAIFVGDGAAASGYGTATPSQLVLDDYGAPTTTDRRMISMVDIINYTGTTWKPGIATISNDKNGSGTVQINGLLWRSTSTISSIKLYTSSGNFVTGSVASLYGIKKA